MSMSGRFVWYELMTSDMDAAETFYRTVVGWGSEPSGHPGPRYVQWKAGEAFVGGLMELPQEARDAGARPGWIGYVQVDDTDAAARRLESEGGAVHKLPQDIPGVGRFAVAADPQGAAFCLFTPLSGEQSEAAAPMTPGHVGWHELHSTDWEQGFAFYASQFGWARDEAMDMGPLGTYQLFAYGHGGDAVGGMMNLTPETPRPFWLYYFAVDDIDAATDRISEAGGRMLYGPAEVPGGAFVVNAMDPQGAPFAIVGMRASTTGEGR